MKKVLTADIGGTNSRFAYFRTDETGNLELVEIKWLKTKDASSFGILLENVKASGFSLKPGKADIAVFALAGPVEDGLRCSPPFISWDIDISNAKNEYGLKKSFLINDFVAQAYACLSEIGEKAELVKTGHSIENAPVAVIGAGTALGKAVIIPDGRSNFIAVPSEGGHTSFPFETREECSFRDFLIKEIGDSYITWNKVVSGRGLCYIHKFLTGISLEPQEVVEAMLPESETLIWASRFYARACRNYALETLSLGGLFITGGVAARTPSVVMNKSFVDEFIRSDTLHSLLVNIPVFLIKDENAGLWGGAVFGQRKMNE
jgi:glucokinase